MATVASKPAILQPSQQAVRELLEQLLAIAREAVIEDLPALIGTLESAKAVAWSRLTAPAPVESQADELLDVSRGGAAPGNNRGLLVSPS